MKKISIVSACYNEKENIVELHHRITRVMATFPSYDYEIVLSDNRSTDGTRDEIRKLASGDKHLKAIFNSANFGQIRSPFNAMMSVTGDAVVLLCADLQESPELIANFIRAWENGAKVVCGVKPQSKESKLMFAVRRLYYKLMMLTSETPQVENFTGFGLYDRVVIEAMRKYRDSNPYLRGLIAEVGFQRVEIPYEQQLRHAGKTIFSPYTTLR